MDCLLEVTLSEIYSMWGDADERTVRLHDKNWLQNSITIMAQHIEKNEQVSHALGLLTEMCWRGDGEKLDHAAYVVMIGELLEARKGEKVQA